MSFRKLSSLAALLALAPLPVFAHVTLAEPKAMPGADYVAHFRVGHGCSGSPTTALTVSIPEGVAAAQPDAPPGWSVATIRSGNRINAVTWKGGQLPADKAGEFILAMKLPAKPASLAFTATQTCEKGVEEWSQLPTADGAHLDHPAPLLMVGDMPAMPKTAAASGPSPVSLSDGWVRLLPGGLPAAGYFTVKNTGTAKLALTGADTPACGMLMLHKSDDKGGMSSMEDVKSVDLPGGGTLKFAPGGYHLMCMDPKPSLKLGASVPVTLSFTGAPPLTAQFEVRNAAGK